MKRIIKQLLFLLPLIGNAQIVQIGQDINGTDIDHLAGYSVSLSSDGMILAVAERDFTGAMPKSGRVTIAEFIDSRWQYKGMVEGSVGDRVGWATDLSADGSILAVGAPQNSDNGVYSGAVRVYKNLNGNYWQQLGKSILGAEIDDQFGRSIALSDDGNTLAIGAPLNDGNGLNSGHVRIYSYDNISDSWAQIGNDINGESSDDQSGTSVTLSADGTIVAIGAPYNDGRASNAGQVRIFTFDGANWVQLGNDIDGGDTVGPSYNNNAGRSVSLSADGTVVAFGEPGYSGSKGRVWVYAYEDSDWVIKAFKDGSGRRDDSLFGYKIILSDDGNSIVTSAIKDEPTSVDLIDCGIVQRYLIENGSFTQIGEDIVGEASEDFSGSGLATSSNGEIIAIGAYGNDDNGNQSGQVRVYGDATLSIEENTFGNTFSLYPNPSVGKTNIVLGSNQKEASLKIFDLNGKTIFSKSSKNVDHLEFDTTGLYEGIYIVQIKTTTNNAKLKLVVK